MTVYAEYSFDAQLKYNLPPIASINFDFGSRDFPMIAAMFATILWEEKDNKIRFVKHPSRSPDHHILTDDEIKQFRWIKLSAVDIQS